MKSAAGHDAYSIQVRRLLGAVAQSNQEISSNSKLEVKAEIHIFNLSPNLPYFKTKIMPNFAQEGKK